VTAAPYNADPSGVADDTAAIQRCIDDVSNAGGGTVFFPSGTYKISITGAGASPTSYQGAISVKSNVTLAGNGQANSIIRLANGQGNYFVIFSATGASNVAVQDLTIDQNGQNNQAPNGASDINGSMPRHVLWTGRGSNFTVQRCRFTNILDCNTISTNGAVSYVTISHNTFDNVGGNSVDFDHSTIFTNCGYVTLDSNSFSSRSGPRTDGARTAIEIHGDHQTITNNNISGYRWGVNVCGLDPRGNDSQVYKNNTMTGCGSGFRIWSRAGLTNCQIEGNNITLDVNGWNGYIDDALGRNGIVEDPFSLPGSIDHLYLVNNTITFTNYGTAASRTPYWSNGIQFRPNTSSVKTNLFIENNHINDSLGSGINMACPVNGLTITGNVVTDPGSSVAALGNADRSAVRLSNNMQNATVQSNAFIDDRATSMMAEGIWEETTNLGNCVYGNDQFRVSSGVVVPEFQSGPSHQGPAWLKVLPLPPTPTPTIIDNGQAGYSESGTGWGNSVYGGYNGNSRVHLAGSGAEKAVWKLSGLGAGSYQIQFTWVAYGNRATNAPYQIYDGSTLRQTTQVNQQLAPSGTSLNGRAFQTIATVQVQSGTLMVTLGDNANGVISADAMAVTLVSS
jgi:hypothetical protein